MSFSKNFANIGNVEEINCWKSDGSESYRRFCQRLEVITAEVVSDSDEQNEKQIAQTSLILRQYDFVDNEKERGEDREECQNRQEKFVMDSAEVLIPRNVYAELASDVLQPPVPKPADLSDEINHPNSPDDERKKDRKQEFFIAKRRPIEKKPVSE